MQAFELLEKEWGEFIGNPNVVVCSSGTSALHLALETLELPKGSEVVVPDFTMIACARAVTMAGLKPVFVDCQRSNLLLNPLCLSIDPKTSAIMIVHIYGRRCNVEAIREHADYNDLAIIEDMAEIHGVDPHPMTDAACWSFYKNKIIAGEEGGVISFKNPEHVEKAKQLRNLGFTDRHDFSHVPRGINARMSNLHAEPILRSLANYETNAAERREIEKHYEYYLPTSWKMPKRDAVWVYDLKLPVLDITGLVVRDLNEWGIEARQSFKPMTSQPEYRLSVPPRVVHRIHREIMYLPVYPGLSEEAVRDTVAALREAVIAHTPVAVTV